VGRWVEFGRTRRITRRIVVRNKVIQLCNRGIQYQRYLKDASQVIVQVVLLVTLVRIYQGFDFEDFLKYGGRDISESSSVSSRSKDDLSGWQTATFTIHRPKTLHF